MIVWSVPKLGTELLENVEPGLDSLGTVWVVCVIIYAINYDLEPMLGEWVSHEQPTARLRTVKNSLDLLGRAKIGPCVFQAKYYLN